MFFFPLRVLAGWVRTLNGKFHYLFFLKPSLSGIFHYFFFRTLPLSYSYFNSLSPLRFWPKRIFTPGFSDTSLSSLKYIIRYQMSWICICFSPEHFVANDPEVVGWILGLEVQSRENNEVVFPPILEKLLISVKTPTQPQLLTLPKLGFYTKMTIHHHHPTPPPKEIQFQQNLIS